MIARLSVLTVHNFKNLWSSLTKPQASIQRVQQRQARLLTSFILVLILLDLFWCIMRVAVDYGDPIRLKGAFLVALGVAIIMLIPYALSRTQYYQLAALLTLSQPVSARGLPLLYLAAYCCMPPFFPVTALAV
jgi:hypothetical protein